MKSVLFVLVAITAIMIVGEANASTPFEVSGTGVDVQSYELDPEVNSIILQVQVSDSKEVLELTFERFLFDSISPEGDDKFFIIIDGEELPYVETSTTSKSRTIEINLSSGVYEVEIFGSHLLGKTIEDDKISSQIKDQNAELLNEKEQLSKQVSDLSTELSDTKAENNVLESENEELGKKIFDPNNLVSEAQVQTNNFSSFIVQQITAITVWFMSFF